MFSWRGVSGKHRNHIIWQATPHCIMWTLWRERNRWNFEDEEKSIQDIKNTFWRNLFEYRTTLGGFFFFFLF
jgi:hypothetical protein